MKTTAYTIVRNSLSLSLSIIIIMKISSYMALDEAADYVRVVLYLPRVLNWPIDKSP